VGAGGEEEGEGGVVSTGTRASGGRERIIECTHHQIGAVARGALVDVHAAGVGDGGVAAVGARLLHALQLMRERHVAGRVVEAQKHPPLEGERALVAGVGGEARCRQAVELELRDLLGGGGGQQREAAGDLEHGREGDGVIR
jgi:hypothetical protein